MPVCHLGRREIRSLTPTDRVTTYYDDQLKGFGLKMRPAGSSSRPHQSWIVEYRPGVGGRGTAKRRLVIGTPETLTPEQARAMARSLLARVELGEDPAAGRQEQRSAGTVDDLLGAYMDELIRAKRKPRTAAVFDGYIANHVVPALGNRKASAVTRADIGKLHREIGQEFPVTANRVVSMLAAAYSYGVKVGLLPKGHHNPASGIDRFIERARERYLTPDELARLGEALRLAETRGLYWSPNPAKQSKHSPELRNRKLSIDEFDVAAIRLLLLTGCRLREILDLAWADVDLARGLAMLPDSKVGRRAVLLGAPALSLLSELRRFGPFVIPAADAKKPRGSIRHAWLAISKYAALDGVRLHDLRHSFAAAGAGAGLGLQLVGRLLGHASPATTQRYAHLADHPLRRAADAVSTALADAMGLSTASDPIADGN